MRIKRGKVMHTGGGSCRRMPFCFKVSFTPQNSCIGQVMLSHIIGRETET